MRAGMAVVKTRAARVGAISGLPLPRYPSDEKRLKRPKNGLQIDFRSTVDVSQK